MTSDDLEDGYNVDKAEKMKCEITTYVLYENGMLTMKQELVISLRVVHCYLSRLAECLD